MEYAMEKISTIKCDFFFQSKYITQSQVKNLVLYII